jgi:SET domain-containing protein 6
MAYAFDIPEEKTTDTVHGNGLGEEEGDDLISDDGEDEKAILSMIPLADMLNADAERNNARLCCDNEDLEMRTIKPIQKGEEIFNDYGQLPRSDLLRRYGYVTDQYALYDVTEIGTSSILSTLGPEGKFHIPTLQHPLRQLSRQELDIRIGLAEREGFYEESYDVCHSGEDGPGIPDGLLALLFLLLANDETIASISNSESSLPNRSKLATALVGRVLAALLQMREKEYATTIEDDEEILQKGNLTTRNVMALQVRLGEKRILREAIQEAQSFTGENKQMRDAPKLQEPPEYSNKKRKAVDTMSQGKKGRSK